MSKIINFPSQGSQMALYTENKIYMGTIAEREDIQGRIGIWMNDVRILPFSGRSSMDDILHTDSICIFWDKVIAFSGPLMMDLEEQH